jgi:hypothetical protein
MKRSQYFATDAHLSRVTYWNQPKMRQKYGFYPIITHLPHNQPVAYLGQRTKLKVKPRREKQTSFVSPSTKKRGGGQPSSLLCGTKKIRKCVSWQTHKCNSDPNGLLWTAFR